MAKTITPETAEKQAIKQYLQIYGCFYYYNLAGVCSFKGIPDLTAIDRNGQVWQIEVKAGKGKQSENQKKFQEEWEARGGKYICGGLDEVINKMKL
jgi:hypothetical protein